MKECPRCHSDRTSPIADVVYQRECQECFFIGEDYEFETDLEPTWSWHILSHDDVAWEIIEVQHWPSHIELASLNVVLAEELAERYIDACRTSAPELGRKLEYEFPEYKR